MSLAHYGLTPMPKRLESGTKELKVALEDVKKLGLIADYTADNPFYDLQWSEIVNTRCCTTEDALKELQSAYITLLCGPDEGASYLISDDLEQNKKLDAFYASYSKEIRKNTDWKSILSAAAYFMATDSEISPLIQGLFYKYSLQMSAHSLLSRKIAGYPLSAQEWLTYKQAYILLLSMDTDADMKKDVINAILKNRWIFGIMYANECEGLLCTPYGNDLLEKIVRHTFMNETVKCRITQAGAKAASLLYFVFRGQDAASKMEDVIKIFFLTNCRTLNLFTKGSGFSFTDTLMQKISEESLSVSQSRGELIGSVFRAMSINPYTAWQNGRDGELYSFLLESSPKIVSSVANLYISWRFIKAGHYLGVKTPEEYASLLAKAGVRIICFTLPSRENEGARAKRNMMEHAGEWHLFAEYIMERLSIDDLIQMDRLYEKKSVQDTEIKRLKDKLSIRETKDVEPFKKRILDLERENASLSSYQASCTKMHHEMEDMRREMEELHMRLEETEGERKELYALRELFYEIGKQQEEDSGSVTFDPSFAEDIRDLRGVVVGGHKNLQNKLSALLPQWRFYEAKQRVIPKDVLLNSDIVVFFTGHIDHATYYSTMNTIGSQKGALLYIENTNLDYIMTRIYEKAIDESLI